MSDQHDTNPSYQWFAIICGALMLVVICVGLGLVFPPPQPPSPEPVPHTSGPTDMKSHREMLVQQLRKQAEAKYALDLPLPKAEAQPPQLSEAKTAMELTAVPLSPGMWAEVVKPPTPPVSKSSINAKPVGQIPRGLEVGHRYSTK